MGGTLSFTYLLSFSSGEYTKRKEFAPHGGSNLKKEIVVNPCFVNLKKEIVVNPCLSAREADRKSRELLPLVKNKEVYTYT